MKGLPNHQQEEEDDRRQCTTCNRKFAPETLTRHQKFCEDKAKSKGSFKFKKWKINSKIYEKKLNIRNVFVVILFYINKFW